MGMGMGMGMGGRFFAPCFPFFALLVSLADAYLICRGTDGCWGGLRRFAAVQGRAGQGRAGQGSAVLGWFACGGGLRCGMGWEGGTSGEGGQRGEKGEEGGEGGNKQRPRGTWRGTGKRGTGRDGTGRDGRRDFGGGVCARRWRMYGRGA